MPYKTARARRVRGRVDATGRNVGTDRYLRLPHYLLKSPAWRSLRPLERALFVEVAQRYNGHNNGEIGLGVREAAQALHVRPQTAGRAFMGLVVKGFLRVGRDSAFNVKSRLAREWIVTLFPYGDDSHRNDFMRWQPQPVAASASEGQGRQQADGDADHRGVRNASLNKPFLKTPGAWPQRPSDGDGR